MKWPGGKSAELERILPLVPPHARFHEPFVGGGALFFHLEPDAGHISDVNGSLIGFYRALIGADRSRTEVAFRALARAWDLTGEVGVACGPGAVAGRAAWATVTRDQMAAHAADLIDRQAHAVAAVAGCASDIFPEPALRSAFVRSLSAKLWRIRNAVVVRGVSWSDEDLADQAETAVRAGFYTYLRDIFVPRSEGEDAMRFFFIREFCYGAMFRLNAAGKFNIPYGGSSYNRKAFSEKVERALGADARALLSRTVITEGGFASCLSGGLTRDDFVFLDPPYDSEFSEYDGHVFGRAEQEQLAEAVAASDAKCLLVMKATPFIEDLYRRVATKSVHPMAMSTYAKLYAYNTKGRNNRAADHLVVRNYE